MIDMYCMCVHMCFSNVNKTFEKCIYFLSLYCMYREDLNRRSNFTGDQLCKLIPGHVHIVHIVQYEQCGIIKVKGGHYLMVNWLMVQCSTVQGSIYCRIIYLKKPSSKKVCFSDGYWSSGQLYVVNEKVYNPKIINPHKNGLFVAPMQNGLKYGVSFQCLLSS